MRMFKWVFGCIIAVGLGGCSLYPIPDDVSPFNTESIVRYGRCEVTHAILVHLLNNDIITLEATDRQIKDKIAAVKAKATKKTPLDPKEEKLLKLAKVAMVYSFDFLITEQNKSAADAGFRLPWLTSNVVDAGVTGALDLTRQGSRVFGAEFNWEDLITNSTVCAGRLWQRPGNLVYPLTGSIGVGRVVETFIDIDEQGGAKDNFVDTLTFTTQASGGADATVKLEPVSNQFRLVSGTVGVSASRLDVHKLTISLAFSHPDAVNPNAGVKRRDGDLNAPDAPPFLRPAPWRARYNLCVQDARTRESTFKQLRLTDPLVYCIAYADSFAPSNGKTVVTTTTTTTQRSAGAAALGGAPEAAGVGPRAREPAASSTTITTTTTPQGRPDVRPSAQ